MEQTLYEVKVPAISVHVEAKDSQEAINKSKKAVIATLKQYIMKPEHWKTTPIVVHK